MELRANDHVSRQLSGETSAGSLSGRGIYKILGGRTVLHSLSVTVPSAQVTALIGPNGSGKSTLLRTLSRLERPDQGSVVLNGRDIDRLRPRELSRELAMLAQHGGNPAAFTVSELVACGRYPYRGPFRRLGSEDRAAVSRAITMTSLSELSDRPVASLSGGERQRAWIAMALAQETDLLLLDEPTTFLDVRHQIEILDLVRSLNQDHGKTIVCVLHDLNQAASYSDHMIVLDRGRIAAEGRPGDIIRPDLIERVFGIRMMTVPHPETGVTLCLPLAATTKET